jgi:hypothetical protein
MALILSLNLWSELSAHAAAAELFTPEGVAGVDVGTNLHGVDPFFWLPVSGNATHSCTRRTKVLSETPDWRAKAVSHRKRKKYTLEREL